MEIRIDYFSYITYEKVQKSDKIHIVSKGGVNDGFTSK